MQNNETLATRFYYCSPFDSHTADCFSIARNVVCAATTTTTSAVNKQNQNIFSCRCGQETRVIPRILQLRSHWMKSEKESVRLVEAGITKEVLNSAIAQFCLEIIAKHGDPARRLCNKDPLTLKMGSYVIELFPEVCLLYDLSNNMYTCSSIFRLNSYSWSAMVERRCIRSSRARLPLPGSI